jgi:hypothetical protein
VIPGRGIIGPAVQEKNGRMILSPRIHVGNIEVAHDFGRHAAFPAQIHVGQQLGRITFPLEEKIS